MKKIIFTILSSLPAYTFAQSLSIEQLWEKVAESSNYQQDSLMAEVKASELWELYNKRLPVVYADANIQSNLIRPVTPVPAIAFDPNADEGAIIPLRFATKWSAKAGVQLEWALFDPKRKYDIAQQELSIKQQELSQQKNIQNWRKNATLAYLSVVLATKQYQTAQQDAAHYEEILQISKVRYEAGRASSAEYISAQQEAERKQIALAEAWRVLTEADWELRKYLNLDGVQHLASDIDAIQAFVAAKEFQNLEIDKLQFEQALSKLKLNSAKAQLLPTLSANAYLGTQHYSNDFKIMNSDYWYGNSFVNLGIRMPLSAYWTVKPTLSKERINLDITGLKLAEEQKNEQIRQEQKKARIDAAQKKVARYGRIEALALEARNNDENAYKAGRLLLSEYNKSLTAHNKAAQDLWQAQYDLVKVLLELNNAQ